MIKNFLGFFWNLASFWPLKATAKVVTCFANNRAWMIRWNLKVCSKDWHLLGKRPQIGLCRKKSNLYIKCPLFWTFVLYPTKQVNYKVSSTAKNYKHIFSNRKKPSNKHLISLVFSVRTVNYGSSFFPHRFKPTYAKHEQILKLPWQPSVRLSVKMATKF